MNGETLVNLGGAVKALGDGRVGGYLVQFTDAEHPDLEADYFDAATDYGPHEQSLAYYQHGFDEVLGCRPLKNLAALERRDTGIWMEHQLDLRDEYERMIYDLVEQGKLGLSSGTAPHLIERKAEGDAAHITRWPLGLDASYTPTPANWQSQIMPLKTWIKTAATGSLIADMEGTTADSANEAEASRPETDNQAVAEDAAEREQAAALARSIEITINLEVI
jgi:hypothetical protein